MREFDLTYLGKNVPGFVERTNFARGGDIPIRIYFHRYGLAGAFPGYKDHESIGAEDYVLRVSDKLDLTSFQSALVFVWGDPQADGRTDAMLDWFAHGKDENWPGNPECNSWVVRNSRVVTVDDAITSPGRQITCGDGRIILGIEEEHRRTAPSPEHYAGFSPRIKGLEFRLDAGSSDLDMKPW